MQTNPKSDLKIDLSQAHNFIECLTGDAETPVTWQLFSDQTPSKFTPIVLHGSLFALGGKLEECNRGGAGVFIAINETDLRGRKAENIVALRALFVDSDNGPIKKTKLPPHIVVDSKNGQHGYWLLAGGEPIDAFTQAQKTIAMAMGTDRSIVDLCRVMRVPGFYHHKSEPYLVTLSKAIRGKPYKISDVLGQFTVNANHGRWTREYAEHALSTSVFRIENKAEGGRHTEIFHGAAWCGEFVAAGLLDEDRVIDALTSAAMAASKNGAHPLTDKEVRRAIIDGIERGKEKREYSQAEEENQAQTKTEDGVNKRSPVWMANQLVKDHTIAIDRYENTYIYNGGVWRGISKTQLKSFAKDYDDPNHTTDRRRGETVSNALVNNSVIQDIITWNKIKDHEIALAQGVLDVLTDETNEHSPKNWLDKTINVQHDKAATCPIWERCLSEWFDHDADKQQKIDALQEFFGYTILNHAKYKKALIMYGESNTGKSQVAGVLHDLVGAENCCQISVSDMDDPRSLAPIKGKLLNIITELPPEALIADGGFKKLVSTGEPIQIDAKYMAPENYTPTCKHVIACNELPNINDKSRATFNRLLIIKFNNVIADQDQDPELSDKLHEELSGVLNWACDGARRLVKNGGRFTEINESKELIEEYRIEQNPILMFLEERYVISGLPTDRIPLSVFTEKFNIWNGGRNWQVRSVGKSIRSCGIVIKPLNGLRYVCGIYEK